MTSSGGSVARAAGATALVSFVVCAALADAWLGDGWFLDAPWLLLTALGAGFLLGAWTPATWSAVGAAGAALGLTIANQHHQPGAYPFADDLVFFLLVVGAPVVAGAALTRRRAQIADLAETGRRLEEQRAADLEAAGLEERQRVETAVHQGLIEQIGGVVLLAEGARAHPAPATVADALSAIEDAARAALGELRGAVGTLRTSSEPDTPAPGGPGSGDAPVEQAPTGRRDVLLAGAVGAAMAVEAVAREASERPAWVTALAMLVVAVPVVWRRSRPFVVLALTGAASVVVTATVAPLPQQVTALALLLVTTYAAGAYGRPWPLALLLGWSVPAAQVLATPSGQRDLTGLVPTLALSTLVVVAGMVAAGAARRAATLRSRVAELERGREIEQRAAVAATRLELARGLHDSVAQAMTIACLQASAARLPGADADAALTALLVTARECMVELRDGLDQLDGHDPALVTPALQRLAASGRLSVDWRVEPGLQPAGEAGALVQRVLREALTNAARHAPGSRVRVRIASSSAGRIEVEVVDDGSDGGRFDLGTGTGLAGLREMLGRRGGSLSAGPLPEGGFRLGASFPPGQEVPA